MRLTRPGLWARTADRAGSGWDRPSWRQHGTTGLTPTGPLRPASGHGARQGGDRHRTVLRAARGTRGPRRRPHRRPRAPAHRVGRRLLRAPGGTTDSGCCASTTATRACPRISTSGPPFDLAAARRGGRDAVAYTLEDMADDTAGLLDALGIEQRPRRGDVHGGHDRPDPRHQPPVPCGAACARSCRRPVPTTSGRPTPEAMAVGHPTPGRRTVTTYVADRARQQRRDRVAGAARRRGMAASTLRTVLRPRRRPRRDGPPDHGHRGVGRPHRRARGCHGSHPRDPRRRRHRWSRSTGRGDGAGHPRSRAARDPRHGPRDPARGAARGGRGHRRQCPSGAAGLGDRRHGHAPVSGPLEGIRVVELAGIGPGPLHLHAPGRCRGRRPAGGPGHGEPAGAVGGPALGPAQPQPADRWPSNLKHPEGVRARPRPRRPGRRPGRGMAPGRGRAPRASGPSRAWSAIPASCTGA